MKLSAEEERDMYNKVISIASWVKTTNKRGCGWGSKAIWNVYRNIFTGAVALAGLYIAYSSYKGG